MSKQSERESVGYLDDRATDPATEIQPLSHDALVQNVAVALFVKLVDPNVSDDAHLALTVTNALVAAATFAAAWDDFLISPPADEHQPALDLGSES